MNYYIKTKNGFIHITSINNFPQISSTGNAYSNFVSFDTADILSVFGNVLHPSGPAGSGLFIFENFDNTLVGNLPSGWSANLVGGTAAVSNTRYNSASNSLGINNGTSTVWFNKLTAENVVTSYAYLPSTAGEILFWLRGSGLNTGSPYGYYMDFSEFVQPRFYRVVAGVPTLVASVLSAGDSPNQWYKVIFKDKNVGNSLNLSLRIQRLSDGYYLAGSNYQQTPIDLLSYTDNSPLFPSGYIGFARDGGGTSEISIDDVQAGSSTDTSTPIVSLSSNQSPSATGYITLTPTITANPGVAIVNYTAGSNAAGSGIPVNSVALSPYAFVNYDTQSAQDDTYLFTANVIDNNNNLGSGTISITINNSGNAPVRYFLTQHQPHMRTYLRSYSSAVQDDFANLLTANYVDMLDDNPNFYTAQAAADPQTIRLYYINVTNMYDRLILDYEDYCDRKGLEPEIVFYHTGSSGTDNISGNGSSAWVPQNFINILSGPENGSYDQTGTSVNFPTTTTNNNAAYFGYFQKWREINFTFSATRTAPYAGVWEYCNSRSLSGVVYSPTHWNTLSLVSDSTSNLTTNGTITFDPPSGWLRCSPLGTEGAFTNMNAPGNLFYIRFRCTNAGGTTPVANSVLARDYALAGNSKTVGIIPVFDYSVDVGNSGYLNNTQYNLRASGKDARFVWESRACVSYGLTRYATRLGIPQLGNWGGDYATRYMAEAVIQFPPGPHGLMFDNVDGSPVINGPFVPAEPIGDSATDAGNLGRGIMHGVRDNGYEYYIQNIAGANPTAIAKILGHAPCAYEEFGIRTAFETSNDFVNRVAAFASRYSASLPPPVYIIDNQADTSFATEPLQHYGHLCYYYLISNPNTMICWEGGYEPGSAWDRHWSPAAAINIGIPTGPALPTASIFDTGSDPSLDFTTALSNLSSIGSNNISVNKLDNRTWEFTFVGALSGRSVPLMTVNISGADSNHGLITPNVRSVTHRYLPGNSPLVSGELQTVMISYCLDGTASVAFSGQSANFAFSQTSQPTSATNMQNALNGLSSIGGVGGSVSVTAWYEAGTAYSLAMRCIFGGTLAKRDLGGQLITVNTSGLPGSVPPVANLTRTTAGVNGLVNEVQQLNLTTASDSSAGGTMTVSFSGQTTSFIPFNAKAANSPPLFYTVFKRDFTNALVLYRPCSVDSNSNIGPYLSQSNVAISLGGTYYPVDSMGRIGAATGTYTLQNGQGVVLYKTPTEQRPQSTTYQLQLPNRKNVLKNTTSDRFFVSLLPGYCLASGAVITPHDNSGSGSFNPATINLGPGRISATFRYNAPSISGPYTISTTNNIGLTNPASVTTI